MSGNFFLYNVNFFRGLRNVLRDMIKQLEFVEYECGYTQVYINAIKLYTNPALIDLIKIYGNIHELLKNDCKYYIDTYFDRMGEFIDVPMLLVSLFRDVNILFDSIECLYISDDINICSGFQYIPTLSSIAFPCDPCVPLVRNKCVETDAYPLAFVIWLISSLGKIFSGCSDVEVSMDYGMVFLMEMTSLVKAYRNFGLIGTTLQNVSNAQNIKVPYTF